MIGVAVVGCGYWGPNVIRNFSALEDCALRGICELDARRLEPLKRRYPAVRATSDYDELLGDPDVDAVAICTPTASHFPLASAALSAGKHVFVEKPLTDSVDTAEQLVELAETSERILQVDHIFVYSGAVQKIRSVIDEGKIGDLLYVDCVRVNLGLFQSDLNVVWDLAAHDVSIISYLVNQIPEWISAIGSAHYGPLESQAYVTIKYRDPLLAHVHVNWLAPVKLRSTLIGGSKQMIVYNDLEPSEKIRIYDKGVTLLGDRHSRERALVDYRTGDMFAPHIERTEPLEQACRTFLAAIKTRTPPLTDGRAGLAVVRILDAAQRSMRKSGERIYLEPTR